MSSHIPLGIAREIRERAQENCEYCLLPQSSQEATFHIEPGNRSVAFVEKGRY